MYYILNNVVLNSNKFYELTFILYYTTVVLIHSYRYLQLTVFNNSYHTEGSHRGQRSAHSVSETAVVRCIALSSTYVISFYLRRKLRYEFTT